MTGDALGAICTVLGSGEDGKVRVRVQRSDGTTEMVVAEAACFQRGRFGPRRWWLQPGQDDTPAEHRDDTEAKNDEGGDVGQEGQEKSQAQGERAASAVAPATAAEFDAKVAAEALMKLFVRQGQGSSPARPALPYLPRSALS